MIEEMLKNMTDEYKLIHREPHSSDNNLVKYCKKCGCEDFVKVDKDWINSTACEQEIRCKHCGQLVNYWSYGHYDNELDDEYFMMEKQKKRQKKIERILK